MLDKELLEKRIEDIRSGETTLKEHELIEENTKIDDICLPIFNPSSLQNLVIYGKCASGKTTKLVSMLNGLLYENPNLRIGVLEYPETPEIKSAVPSVISLGFNTDTKEMLKDLDLFICTCDYYMCKVANEANIPVWLELNGGQTAFEEAKSNLPCLQTFNYIYMEHFKCKEINFAVSSTGNTSYEELYIK